MSSSDRDRSVRWSCRWRFRATGIVPMLRHAIYWQHLLKHSSAIAGDSKLRQMGVGLLCNLLRMPDGRRCRMTDSKYQGPGSFKSLAVVELARILFENMEHLDPGSCGGCWSDLRGRDVEYYVLLVESL